MPLDAARASDRTEALTDAFAELGRANGTAMPPTRKTKDKLAFEYWVASLLNRLAEARRDKAKRVAVAGGVLPDHAANPLPVGTSEIVFVGERVTIALKVVGQTDRVNVPALMADLVKAGVKPAVLKRLVKKHTESFAGAHVFTASVTG